MLKWLWVTILVVFFDQLTKWMAEANLELGEIIPTIIPNFNWSLAYNTGAAFGMLSDAGGWQRWFFAILAIVISILIVIWIRKLKDDETWTAVALALVLGGALGNLIDRVLHGKVIDFIDFYLDWDVFFLSKWADGFSHFATFNVADMAITLGAAVLVIMSLFHKEEDEPQKTRTL